MNSVGKVSVIIPCFNVEDYINESIFSIINQSVTDFEILCLDDASTDSTYTKLMELKLVDSRIKVFRNETNLGLIDSLNRLVDLSNGDVLIRMDPDDVSSENRVESLIKFMNETGADVVGSAYTIIDQKGNEKISSALYLPKYSNAIKYTCAFNSPLPHATVAYKKSFAKTYGYEHNCFAAEDFDLWVRAVNANNKLVYLNIPESLYFYRIHTDSTSNKNRNIQIKSHFQCVLNFKRKNLPKSYLYGSLYVLLMNKCIPLDKKDIGLLHCVHKEIEICMNEFFKVFSCNKDEVLEIKTYTGEYSLLLYSRFLSGQTVWRKVFYSAMYPYFLVVYKNNYSLLGAKLFIKRVFRTII